MTTQEVAAQIRETPDNVRRRCAQGQIRAKKIGKEWRISEDDVTLFMTPSNTGSPRKRLTNRQRQQLAS